MAVYLLLFVSREMNERVASCEELCWVELGGRVFDKAEAVPLQISKLEN